MSRESNRFSANESTAQFRDGAAASVDKLENQDWWPRKTLRNAVSVVYGSVCPDWDHQTFLTIDQPLCALGMLFKPGVIKTILEHQVSLMQSKLQPLSQVVAVTEAVNHAREWELQQALVAVPF